jgi:hypothetical protein
VGNSLPLILKINNMFNENEDFDSFEGDELPQRLGQLLMATDGFRDILIENSIEVLRDPKFQMEYVLEESIDIPTKLQDIDELIEWGVEREMYEDCAMLVKLKERVIETFDVQSLIK